MNPETLISVGSDLRVGSPDYKRFATMESNLLSMRWSSVEGETKLNRWKTSGFDRATLENIVGRINGKYDVRGIPLAGANLKEKDLSDCDFFCADFSQANLWNANLNESYLSQANLKGTDLSWIRVKGTLVDNVTIDRETVLLGIDLNGINTNFALHFLSEARDQQRIDDLQRRHPKFALFLRITCDYGRSLWLWSFWTLGMIILFGLIYSSIPGGFHTADFVSGSIGHFDSFYFSAVTFTTLGFGDISPLGVIAKTLVVVEVLLGYLMGGILVAILTRRVLG